MPETEIEAMRNFLGSRFEVGEKVEYCGEKDSPETRKLFEGLYGLEPGNRYVVEDQKINVIPGTLSPGGPQADTSYQEISLEGMKDKQRESTRPLFLSSSFFAPVEESTKKSE